MDNLRVFFSTWNVATNSPSQDLSELLDLPSVKNKLRPLPDFYIVGFQEVNSQPHSVVMDAFFSDPWTNMVNKILAKNDYVRVESIRLQGLLLLVFCLNKHRIHLRDIEKQYTRTGLGGMWGNKGAVSIRLNIYGCSICVVNSHLPPHDHQPEKRVSDYKTIIKSNTFHIKDTSNIMLHDYVFWLGDLNFRLSETGPKSSQDVLSQLKVVEKDDYSGLLQHDQLRMVMASGDAFSELTETLPHFPPTYKFKIGSSKYDEKRRPAWTDRILYKNVNPKAQQLNYYSLHEYTISDHKPVVSEFIIKIRTEEKVTRVYTKPLSSMDGSVEFDGGEFEETIAFSNFTESCVDFSPINNIWYWYIGDADFVVKFTLSTDVVVYPNDWIAIYEADFDNLEDYITYEYVSKVFLPGSSQRIFVFSFPVGSGVRRPGFYQFVYFNQPSSDVKSLLGISNPFEVRMREKDNSTYRRESSTTDLQAPSTSTSYADSWGQDSIIKNFTNFHIPRLMFNTSNDLSID